MIEVQGDWIGFYAYDLNPNENRKIPFRANINRGINEFVGRIYEDADHGGIDDEIVIRGHMNDDEIEFNKYYAKEHYLDENNESVSIESENPNIVHYKGTFDESTMRFKGVWEIAFLEEDDEGILHEANESGKWEMWREPNNPRA